MTSILWCLRQKNGLELGEPSLDVSRSYLAMADESCIALNAAKQSRIWSATISYYIFYYALYALMLRLGVKCEIHTCSLLFMKAYLQPFYTSDDVVAIEKAFQARIDAQYYSDRSVSEQSLDEVKNSSIAFLTKTKGLVESLSIEKTQEIRTLLAEKLE